jgi:hypothetical protein
MLSMVCNCLRAADQSALLDWLEEVVGDITANCSAEV